MIGSKLLILQGRPTTNPLRWSCIPASSGATSFLGGSSRRLLLHASTQISSLLPPLLWSLAWRVLRFATSNWEQGERDYFGARNPLQHLILARLHGPSAFALSGVASAATDGSHAEYLSRWARPVINQSSTRFEWQRLPYGYPAHCLPLWRLSVLPLHYCAPSWSRAERQRSPSRLSRLICPIWRRSP